jgi:hypothetical protein
MSSQTSGPFARNGLAVLAAALAAGAAETTLDRKLPGISCILLLPYTLA